MSTLNIIENTLNRPAELTKYLIKELKLGEERMWSDVYNILPKLIFSATALTSALTHDTTVALIGLIITYLLAEFRQGLISLSTALTSGIRQTKGKSVEELKAMTEECKRMKNLMK